MKRLLKRSMASMLALMMVVGVSGCGKEVSTTESGDTNKTVKKEEQKKEKKDVKYPVVSWYIRPSAQKDMDLVVEELNKIFREKVGAELEIKRIDPGDYNQKMLTTLASGETFDMMHSAPRYGYFENVAKGAYLPLDDLLAKFAPKTLAEIRPEFWDAARVDGKIYGLINYQIFGRQNGLRMRKDVYDSLNVKDMDIKTIEDIDTLLPKIAESAKGDDIAFNMFKNDFFKDSLTYYGLDPIDNNVGVVRIGEEKPVVENRYNTEEFKSYLNLVHKWYQAGYIPKDAPTVDYNRDLVGTGRVMAAWGDYKPGNEFEVNTMFGGEMVYLPIEKPFVNTQNVIGTMTSISRTSKNPELAMKMLELVNTDSVVYNLLINGIEGKHYNKVGDNKIEPIKDSGYAPNCGWMVGNQFNAYLMPGQPDDVWEKTKEVNNSSMVSSVMGFSLDSAAIKNEMAQCQSVFDEFIPILVSGAVDPDEYLPKMLDKLESAGIQKLIDEENKQLQEWLSQQ